jgi:hypothetical protein
VQTLTEGHQGMRTSELEEKLLKGLHFDAPEHKPHVQLTLLALLHDKPEGFKDIVKHDAGTEVWHKAFVGNMNMDPGLVADELGKASPSKYTLKQLRDRPDVLTHLAGIEQQRQAGVTLSPEHQIQLKGFKELLSWNKEADAAEPLAWIGKKLKAAQVDKEQGKLRKDFLKFIEVSDVRLASIKQELKGITTKSIQEGGVVGLAPSLDAPAPEATASPSTYKSLSKWVGRIGQMLNKPVINSAPKSERVQVDGSHARIPGATRTLEVSEAEFQRIQPLLGGDVGQAQANIPGEAVTTEMPGISVVDHGALRQQSQRRSSAEALLHTETLKAHPSFSPAEVDVAGVDR